MRCSSPPLIRLPSSASSAIAFELGDRFLPPINNNGTSKHLHIQTFRTAAA
ncbi:MAG: hypothetical protein U7126_02705 [Microcoleus sp.]